jgi:tRNA(Ile)-lysidine synthase
MSKAITQQVHTALNAESAYEAKRWVLAYSGGPDSRALLHLLATLKPKDHPLVLFHVHHGLSDEADAWEVAAQEVIHAYLCVECVTRRVTCDVPGKSLEEAARDARYAALEAYVEAGDLIMTGHHLNDNAETFLFRLFRGTGLKGMTGMPRSRRIGAARLIRPLLSVSRQQIEQYVASHQLSCVEDASNHDTDITRNAIRWNILPRILERWPKALYTFEQEMGYIQEAISILEEVAQADFASIESQHPRRQTRVCVAVEGMQALSPARAKQVFEVMARRIKPNANIRGQLDELYKGLVTHSNTHKIKQVVVKGIGFESNGIHIWIR